VHDDLPVPDAKVPAVQFEHAAEPSTAANVPF
jgi:hypothetical protein